MFPQQFRSVNGIWDMLLGHASHPGARPPPMSIRAVGLGHYYYPYYYYYGYYYDLILY